MNYKKVTKKLRALGCNEILRRGGGSHRKWLNPATGRGTVIPDWGIGILNDPNDLNVLNEINDNINQTNQMDQINQID